MARQKPAAAPDWTLTTEQAAAVELLVSGTPANDIAAALKVSLETLSTWRTQHPGIQAALNARRQELWVRMGDRLRALLPKACEVLEQELEGEHRLQAAVHILRPASSMGQNLLLARQILTKWS
jgi:DNA-binding NarL/FixJ family response regulator